MRPRFDSEYPDKDQTTESRLGRHVRCGRLPPHLVTIVVSTNGRSPSFDLGNLGSNPSVTTICFKYH